MSSAPTYIHKVHPRAKRITIRVNKDGQVIVTSPRFTPKWTINSFVSQQQSWIQKQLSQIEAVPFAQNEVLLFGKHYQKELDYSAEYPTGVRIEGSRVLLNPTAPIANVGWTDEHHQQFNSFLKRTARSYILPRTAQLSEVMQIEYGQIRFKEQKSRWGSCSSDGNLNFNWRLVHCPPPVIDYVIVHELAHRTYMDHSQRFWNLVAKYVPDYSQHRGWLKRTGRFLF